MTQLVYGFLIGCFVTLIGGGGASLYLGVLTGQAGLPITVAAPTSLFVALPALFFGFLSQKRVGNVHHSIGNKLLVTAIPSIIVGSIISKFIPLALYNWIIGLLLIVMGLSVLMKIVRKKNTSAEQAENAASWKPAILGIISGLMVGIGGLSGGATTVAGLTLLGLSAVHAVGTSTYVLFIMSAVGFLSHLFIGKIAWMSGVPLMIGAIIGSVITPIILQKFNYTKLNKLLTPVLGLLIIYFGLKMLF